MTSRISSMVMAVKGLLLKEEGRAIRPAFSLGLTRFS